jgi:hypothetical protein
VRHHRSTSGALDAAVREILAEEAQRMVDFAAAGAAARDVRFDGPVG